MTEPDLGQAIAYKKHVFKVISLFSCNRFSIILQDDKKFLTWSKKKEEYSC